jgi:peroxiredoxin
MAQLRLGYPEFQRRSTEVLQVTMSTAEEARGYGRHYRIAFPYLCDPTQDVFERYGVARASLGMARGAGLMVKSAAVAISDRVLRGEPIASPMGIVRREGAAAFTAPRKQAVVLIDRQGVVRHVYTAGATDTLPSTETLLARIEALRGA